MALPKDLNDRQHRKFRQDPTSENQSVVATQVVGGMVFEYYDYISATQTTISQTFVFKNGGSGGDTVATVLINYTDSTKEFISEVTKT